MALKLRDIRFATDLPKMPESALAVRCSAPRFEDRERGLRGLAERLDLGPLQDVDTQYGRMMKSKRGDVEYFAASGAVWSANVRHERRAESEFLDWENLGEGEDADGQPILVLRRKAANEAVELAREMSEIGGFDLKHAVEPQVHLMQVAQANRKGETLRTGAGEATVAMGYAFDDLPVIGAGGKTLIDMIPVDGKLHPTGAVNVWRTPQEDLKVEIGGTEAALEAGLLRDPDLRIAAKKGAKITIERIRLGLMALPAAIHQGVLFPALEYEARVDQDRKQDRYFVGRVAPVATPEAFAKVGLASEHFGLGM